MDRVGVSDLLARQEGANRLWYHQDHLGSVRAMTDAVGAPQVEYEYAAFGDSIETTGTADNLRGYGAHWRDDESHLLYMGARYQDPVLGRFTQPDPVVPEPGDPQSWNRYSYVRNNPVNRIDPTGNIDLDIIGDGGSPEARKAVSEIVGAVKDAARTVDKVEDAIVDTAVDAALKGADQIYDDPDGVVDKMLDAAKDEQTREILKRAVEQVPEDWKAKAEDDGGVKFSDPNNPHNNIRVSPGDEKRKYPVQRSPYVQQRRHGHTIDTEGNEVDYNTGPAHIPAGDFRYRP